LRTPESKAHEKTFDSSAVFEFEIPGRVRGEMTEFQIHRARFAAKMVRGGGRGGGDTQFRTLNVVFSGIFLRDS
jgi:hypothetical protein